MVYITANELKKHGVSIIENALEEENEIIITVRGKSKYIVFNMDTYNKLREYELEAALNEVKEDMQEGRYVEESVEDHIKRLKDEL